MAPDGATPAANLLSTSTEKNSSQMQTGETNCSGGKPGNHSFHVFKKVDEVTLIIGGTVGPGANSLLSTK